MRFLVLALCLFTANTAWSCSCYGTTGIELAIAGHPILVEGEVVSLEQTSSPEFGKRTRSATLRVAKVLRGSVDSDEVTVVHSMCYASLVPNDMQMHHTYVLPLSGPAPEPPPPVDGVLVDVDGGPAPGQYEMAGMCSHSGLELIHGELYTFEQDTGRARRLQHYTSYSAFTGWMLVARPFSGVVGLYDKFGFGALALTIIVTTVGAYRVARHRPWWLVPVILFSILLYVLSFWSAVVRSTDAGDDDVIYGVLSLIAPVIVLVGATLGYLARRRGRRASTQPARSPAPGR